MNSWRKLYHIKGQHVSRSLSTAKAKYGKILPVLALDAGVKKDPKFAGTRIPTFNEAIDCLPKEGIWINIHCKGKRTAREVARKVKAKGRLHQSFMAGREKITRAAREAVPEMATCLFMTCPSGRGATWTDDDLDAMLPHFPTRFTGNGK